MDPVKDTTTQQAQQVAQFVAQLQTMTVAAAASTHGGAGGAGLHSAFPWPLPSPAMATSKYVRQEGFVGDQRHYVRRSGALLQLL